MPGFWPSRAIKEKLTLSVYLQAITAIKKSGPLAPITSFLGGAAFHYIGRQIR
jgi:hypothetical protein